MDATTTGRQLGYDASAISSLPPTAARKQRKIGVIELIAYTVASEWTTLFGVSRFKRQLYGIMPQVVAAWCRALGHRVSYATYYGQSDPELLLPDDLDVVFIAATTQASALAYALARLYRARGVVTIAGGPHAKCFPEDCARFFDFTVKRCDQNLIADILAGHFDPPTILDGGSTPTWFPTVEERLPEIAVASFEKGRPLRSSVISLYGSVGCPYSCGFCTDWNSRYVRVPAAQLASDLKFVAARFPGTMLGFQDPNFGVRFDETMDLLESQSANARNPYLMQCSLSVLSPQRLRRLKDTNCLYVAPGIESWFEFGNKMKLVATRGGERVDQLVQHFAALHEHVPGLQANFVTGLDSDEGDEPFELTARFLTRTPYVWPNINVLTPYGGTPIYDQMVREGRLLAAMPLALYCSPYLALVLRNYDAVEYYTKLIRLLEASISTEISLSRALLRDKMVIKLARLAQTIAVRRDIAEMRKIRDALESNRPLRIFHEGHSTDLPVIYRRQLWQRLGRYAELLTPEDLVPIPALTH
jgi:radical SAM superfamily enzyme YgiQ (UPF0313 family)